MPFDDQRVALVLLSAIGDVVHGLPLAASLKNAAPGVRLEWFVQPTSAPLLVRHPAIERTWIVERHRGWRGFVDLARKLRGERFDLVVDPQVYGKASLVTWLIDAPWKLGFDRRRARELNWLVTNDRIPSREDRHVREQYLEFADHLGIEREYRWELPLTAEERESRDRLRREAGGPVAALVVATSRGEKDWPAHRWAKLAEALTELGYVVCIVGGDAPRERATATEVVRRARCPVRDERHPDIRHLLWLVDAAALVVSPDTGPFHLAVARGVPSVGLFGVTDPARHGPGRRFTELVVDTFHDPGEAWHPPTPRMRPGRMGRIEVEEVLEKVELARARYPRVVGGPTPEGARSPA